MEYRFSLFVLPWTFLAASLNVSADAGSSVRPIDQVCFTDAISQFSTLDEVANALQITFANGQKYQLLLNESCNHEAHLPPATFVTAPDAKCLAVHDPLYKLRSGSPVEACQIEGIHHLTPQPSPK